jgi:chromosome segregation ATPase
VEQFVSSEAKRLHSEGLQLLAQRIVADPFAKVTKLIKDLIARLQQEQSAATTHKDYCDTNMGKSKLDHDKLTKDLDHLDLELKQDKAEIEAKTTEIAELSSQVAEVTQKLSEATALRKQENEDNKATIEDAKAAQQAVESAIKILTDFYEGASSATAFAQKSASHGSSFVSTKETPVIGGALWNSLATPDEGNVDTDHVEGMQTFGEKYVGQTDKAGSVLALMQVLVGDFANLQAETEAAEQLALKQYTALVSDLTTDRKLAEQQSDQAEGRVAALKQKVTEDTRDFELVEDKKLAHERFQVTLEQQCVDKGSSFEERQQKRREEIKSLQEAYEILDRSVS